MDGWKEEWTGLKYEQKDSWKNRVKKKELMDRLRKEEEMERKEGRKEECKEERIGGRLNRRTV